MNCAVNRSRLHEGAGRHWPKAQYKSEVWSRSVPFASICELGHEKTCLMSVSLTKISSLMLASVAEQASLSLTWSETPEDRFVFS